MKTVHTLLLVLSSTGGIAFAAPAEKVPTLTLRFAEVVEVNPRYVQVPCASCGGTPDLRFTGTTFKYSCDGELYENWTMSELQVGLRVQVAGCGNLVVTNDRKAIIEGRANESSQ
jgi:hypothetical protein